MEFTLKMPEEEIEIMRDIYRFLRDHDDPPMIGTKAATEFWVRMVRDMAAVAVKWDNHPLATIMMRAVNEYLERKSKGEGRR